METPTPSSKLSNTPCVRYIQQDVPSDDLCWIVNPGMWAMFCRITRREIAPSDLWTEASVQQFLDQYAIPYLPNF